MKQLSQQRFRFSGPEFLGAFGDISTLLPLVLGLIIYNGIDPRAALILLGATYISTGLYYRLPVPVQPLKATAMIAIATGATRSQIAAAALLMAVILLGLRLTRLVDKLDKLFPHVLVRGVQFGLGLLMVRTGVKLVLAYHSGIGATLKGVHSTSGYVFPSAADFGVALTALVLPQIPLTLANSIVATRDCALKYFGDDGEYVTTNRLAVTVAIGNIAAGLFGGVPVCHGAGGMTAHYRLGARSGAMGLIIGSVLVVCGFAGRGILSLIEAIPAPVLGVLLFYVGIRHAALAKNELAGIRTAVVVVTVGVISYFTGNMLYAAAGGWLVKWAALDLRICRERR